MEEFLLCPLFSWDELNVIDKKEVDRPVARAEGGRVVVADCIDELIGKVLAETRDARRAGKQVTSPVTNRVEQVRLAEADAAIDEQGVIRARRKLRDSLTGGLGELVGRSDDEGVEGVAGVQPFGRAGRRGCRRYCGGGGWGRGAGTVGSGGDFLVPTHGP